MNTIRLPLRVVFYYECDRWVAHCLEFDLLGDGDSQTDALDCLSKAVSLQIGYAFKHDNPTNLFTPAEGKYFHMFAKGTNIAVGELQVHLKGFELEQVETREFSDELDSQFATA